MKKERNKKQIAASLRNIKLATEKKKSISHGEWFCKVCKIEKRATIHQLRKTYCSKECMAIDYKIKTLGSNNPNFKNSKEKICKYCGKTFYVSQKQKYCSHSCFVKDDFPLRTHARKDLNHKELVDILEMGGASVKDTSKLANGFPDILVWHFNEWHLIEIKNPKTSYGKKGLSKSQKSFAENWNGGPVFVLKTSEDAKNFLNGKFEFIEQVGKNKKLNIELIKNM
jgi:hypothetical protein